jgi:hypothetical protein
LTNNQKRDILITEREVNAMVTRTVVEKKVFSIRSNGQMMCGQGYMYDIDPIVWADGKEWVSDEECDRLLAAATADWEQQRKENPWGTTSHQPELKIYWEPIEISY